MNNTCPENKARKVSVNYLDCGERIYFTGTYDIMYFNNEDNYSTVQFFTGLNPLGYNVLTNEYKYVHENSMPSTNFLKETYTIACYEHRMMTKKVGQITFDGLYPDNGSEGITASDMEVFTCLGGIGLFRNVTKVVIDFSCPERTVYFIGLCQNMPKYKPPTCC